MPIRSNCDNERYCHIKNRHQLVHLYSLCDGRYCHIKIGTNWYLFIHSVMRDTVICIKIGTNWRLFIHSNCDERSAPVGADLDMTISLRSTVRMNKEAPIGADLDMINCLTRAIRIKR